jgi:hypothetical protein
MLVVAGAQVSSSTHAYLTVMLVVYTVLIRTVACTPDAQRLWTACECKHYDVLSHAYRALRTCC